MDDHYIKLDRHYIDIFKAAQPYSGGNQVLHDLDTYWNISKHRNNISTFPTVMHNVQAMLQGPVSSPSPSWDHDKDELLLADCAPGGNYYTQIAGLRFELIFKEYGIGQLLLARSKNMTAEVEKMEVLPSLRKMEVEVRKILIAIEQKMLNIVR